MQKLTLAERTLHNQFSEYGRNAREWLRKCAMLLPEIDRRQIWKKRRCRSIYEYAAKLAGMGRSSVDTALWVINKIEDKPALLDAVQKYGVNKVKAVANVATKETQDFWAKKLGALSQHTLETYVRESRKSFRAERSESENLSFPQNPPKTEIILALNPKLALRLDALSKRTNFETLLEKALDQIEEELDKEKPEPVRTSSRDIPKPIENYSIEKTGGKCAYPACYKPYEILHHTQRFALEKIHDPDRLVPLCKAHERLAHHGLIENEDEAPENWRLREEPDKTDPKFYVDTLVSLYRH